MRRFGSFMRDVWYLCGPYFRSEEKWSAWGLLLLVLAADLALVRISVLFNVNGGAWVNALQNYDATSFFNLLFLWEPSPDGPFGIIPGFVPLVALAVAIVVNEPGPTRCRAVSAGRRNRPPRPPRRTWSPA